MIIRFISPVDRVNSFGEFKAKKGGRLYDVSNEIGEQLLTIPTLFEPKSGPLVKPDAKSQIIEVEEDDEPEELDETKDSPKINYTNLTSKQMVAECHKRGLPVQNGSRKSTLAKQLEEDDAAPKDDRTLEQKLEEEFTEEE